MPYSKLDTLSIVLTRTALKEEDLYIDQQDIDNGYASQAEIRVFNKEQSSEFTNGELSINGKVVPGYVDWADLMFNFALNDSHSKWWRAERNSQDPTLSNFFPISCSCGNPGCAGIYEGIQVRYRRHTVEWVVPVHKGYPAFKPIYRFSRQEYEALILSVLQFYTSLSTENPLISRNEGYGICHFEELAEPYRIWQGIQSLQDLTRRVHRRCLYAKATP